ncbi:MAG: ABC transporter permease [Lachnospiraceae bacterium]|nr:ABC transporter permease [Lachnospiraceae bacterium]MDY5742293.1 ABC transporter permease [Lachnospiraceae bacterium]
MSKLVSRLAITNLYKNRQLYIPYSLAVITNLSILYIFISLMKNPHITELIFANATQNILAFGAYVVCITALVIILYANGFVMKNRSKELGLYHILGLEKKHLHAMLLIENTVFAGASILISLLFGSVLDRFMYTLLLRITRLSTKLKPVFSFTNVWITVLVAIGIFTIVLIINSCRLGRMKTLELLREKQKGEKKARLLLPKALLGCAILGFAYYLAWTVKPKITAIPRFFQASLLVILATYLLFHAGTLALLKWLQRRDRFYYRTNNMITVSNLLFRMRKNAIGLASICILSTMTLVTVATTTALFMDSEAFIKQLYPSELNVTMQYQLQYGCSIEEMQNKYYFTADDLIWSRPITESGLDRGPEFKIPLIKERENLEIQIIARRNGNQYSWTREDQNGDIPETVFSLQLPISYEKIFGTPPQLADDEIYLAQSNTIFKAGDIITVGEKQVRIKEVLDYKKVFNLMSLQATPAQNRMLLWSNKPESFFTVKNFTGIHVIQSYGFDIPNQADRDKILNLLPRISDRFNFKDGFYSISTGQRSEQLPRYMGIIGSLFFIGIFLGLLFLTGTVLIIYYKQISEGFEDRSRFKILKKVGLDERHIRSTIRRQIIVVFFLPMLMTLLHIIFAYQMIYVILGKIIEMVDTDLIIKTIGGTCILFVIFYIFIYLLTAHSYRRIAVSETAV